MKTENLMQNWEFNDKDKDPKAEPIYVASDSRIIRFALRPGQSIREHKSPHSPVYIVILQGQGMFTGKDTNEQVLGPNSLIVYEAGENHTIRALDEDLVFVTFEHGVPGLPKE